MLSWRILVGLFCCSVKTQVTQCQAKALFPGATRVKRGLTTVVNPTFHKSLNDIHLLFEILMAGIHFEPNGAFSVEDAELSSLQKTRTLDIIFEEIIPKNVTDISRLIVDLSNHTGPLHQDDFERTLLTLVYTAQNMISSTDDQRIMWGESFVSLFKAIKKDLTLTS
ncbi:protein FAM180A-like [Kryptolebias marmoratus]|uniref:Protein FAM180A-like n=1 Tax=Kryptolebias marmoratus TaxID=37003 RepID=A0A3Q3H220_KRYMA|nr:protein FAM180A-like [Kryptolebias marmoratus]